MKERTLKTKLLTVLLTLCMVLSLTAFTAYAGELPKPDYLPEGVTYSNDYDHTYHTQVNVTANVSVKDSDGTVVETTQVSKSTEEFLKGGVGMLQSNIARLQTEIETPYQDKGTLARENESGQSILDHFESAELYTFIPTSGDPVEFGMDLDAAKKYFNEHPDATGTFTKILDVHEYQKYNYTYDLNVQQTGQPESTITAATIENVKFDYQLGDAPQATAAVAAADQGKYRIYDECWQELNENDEPVAIWHSNDRMYSTLPTITAFESGKKYVYSVLLMPEGEYDFARKVAATVNGNTVTAVPAVDGYLSLPNVKTITPMADSHTHSYGTDWKSDTNNHWHECACGDKADTAAHTFKWVTDKEATATEKGSKHEECTVCGYKKAAVDIPATGSGDGSADQPNKPGNTSSPQTGDNNSLAFWFAVLLVSGGVLTVLGIISKKKSKNALK